MGTARSGTSFLGDALSLAPEVAYLREPITDPIWHRKAYHVLCLHLHERPPPRALVRLADRAFTGPLPANMRVTKRPKDAWSPQVTTRLVKEVHPLASKWLTERYGARYVSILRHPAGIAASWWGRGWGPAPHELTFTNQFAEWGIGNDRAERLGAIIGAHEEAMFETLASREDAIQVRYEEVAEEPLATIHHLYSELGLTWTDEIAEYLAATTQGRAIRNAPVQLVREARSRTHAWRDQLEEDAIRALRRGYELGGGTAYLGDW